MSEQQNDTVNKRHMNELALFAGAGGGILGGHLLGWKTVCAVECDPYARDVLVARQNDGSLSAFPIWDDVRTFDGRPWQGAVDVVSGGFPCQDISVAGKGVGIDGERSGLWREMARIISEVRPRFAFVENSPMLVRRGLARVLGDFAEMGFDCRWGVLGACDTGAPHKRDRVWIVANASSQRTGHFNRPPGNQERKADRKYVSPLRQGDGADGADRINATSASDGYSSWWKTEPAVGRVAHGVADRVDRLRCIGNGQVPAVAAFAWRRLTTGWV